MMDCVDRYIRPRWIVLFEINKQSNVEDHIENEQDEMRKRLPEGDRFFMTFHVQQKKRTYEQRKGIHQQQVLPCNKPVHDGCEHRNAKKEDVQRQVFAYR